MTTSVWLCGMLIAGTVLAPFPANAWSIAWCANGQNDTPSAAGNAWCAAHFPKTTVAAPTPTPAPIVAAPTPAPIVAAPTPDPGINQSQNQSQNQTQTAGGGAGGNALVNNNVAGNYGYVPVYAPAPMAGCGDSASLNAAVGYARSTGFLPYSSASVQVGATIPIGHHSRYCATPAPLPAPITNIYNSTPQVVIQPPVVVAPAAPVAIPRERIVYRERKPACAKYPAHDIAAAEERVRELRHRRSTPADEHAITLLEAACVPVAKIVDP